MVRIFQGIIGWSKTSESIAAELGIPFLWIPGGCNPARAIQDWGFYSKQEEPMTIGYFGSLAPHAGISELLDGFGKVSEEMVLKFCGYGKQTAEILTRASSDSRIRFEGLLSPEECLKFALNCHVLINPRPLGHGNENNFPSKIFEYALTGRAILTTGFAGVREVVGEDGFYLDETSLTCSITRELEKVAQVSREDLKSRSASTQKRVIQNLSWASQARKMADFLTGV
jgi:glycosyltransferase involved in cell wall biosynthesis